MGWASLGVGYGAAKDKLKKHAPPPPDYGSAAMGQHQSSVDAINAQTQANRPNQSNAFGSSVNWTQGPDGQWTQQQSFSGGIGQAAQGLQNQMAGMAQPMDWGQFGEVQDGSAARDQAIDAAYGQATSRLNPQWEQREEAMRAQLANQGLDPNSEAARNAGREMNLARNDAYGSAMNSAIAQGQAAGDSVFRNNMMARQQAVSEALRQRSQPMEELLALQGFTGQQGFAQAGAAQPAQLLPAAIAQGNYQLPAWQAQNQANADMWGGIFDLGKGIAGAAVGASDERVKEDIVRLPEEALPGVPFATWVFKKEFDPSGKRHKGVIAQDLEKVAPQYVHTRSDGVKMVDYSFLKGGKP